MRVSFVIVASAAVIGLILGSLLQTNLQDDDSETKTGLQAFSPVNPAQDDPADTVSAQVARVVEQLALEVEARQELQRRVDKLSDQLSDLSAERAATASVSAEPQNSDTQPANEGAWFNEQALIDSGIDASEANRIKAVYEDLALQRLYTRDQAIREGWDDSKRREAFQALEDRQQALQEELGEDAYDAYLYASGQPNRIQVQAVLPGSAADSAGLRNGDYIISYADERVYNGRALSSATTGGSAQEMITVTVLRDNKVEQLYIPRGPLGIRMRSASVPP